MTRFIEHDIDQLSRLLGERLAIDSNDILVGIDFCPQLSHDFAINGHPALLDESLASPAGSYPGVS